MKEISKRLSIGLVLLASGCESVSLNSTSRADTIEKTAAAVVSIGDASHTIASGFFVTRQLLVTNHHVTLAGDLYIVHDDGRRSLLQLLLSDEKQDVAVFHSRRYQSKKVLSIQKRPPRVGDLVIAIGNPFGAGMTASAGIISALPRAIGNQPFLQTDAAINPGNSGGPLISEQGEVVGVVTSRGAVGSGIGFALPADQLVALVQLAKNKAQSLQPGL